MRPWWVLIAAMIGKIRLSYLYAAAPTRPPGYLDEVLSSGRIEDAILYIDHEVYLALRKKYAPKLVNRKTGNLRRPGDVFGLVILKLSGQQTANCGLCG